MNRLTVIIPSKSVDNLASCVGAIRLHDPDVRILVVDDGVNFNDWQCRGLVTEDLYRKSMTTIPGVKPFVFARNVNIGINAAREQLDVTRHSDPGKRFEAIGPFSDVVVMNDDAILESPLGLTLLQQSFLQDPKKVGLVSATTNISNSLQQWPKLPVRPKFAKEYPLRFVSRTVGLSCPSVAFVCVFIPATTLERVGLLDERFVTYGWEDTDYCKRVHDAGLAIGIQEGCFVDHSRLRSSFRGDPRSPGDITAGRKIFIEKWGSL